MIVAGRQCRFSVLVIIDEDFFELSVIVVERHCKS